MSYRKYSEIERQEMAKIYVESSSVREAIERIRNELGIILPVDGRSLRLWQKKYNLKKKNKSEICLFPEVKSDVEFIPKLMSFEDFQKQLQFMAGEALIEDKKIMHLLLQELRSSRIKESLKEKTIEELLLIRSMIEERQQKREAHLIKMSNFIDYKKVNSEDLFTYDNEILAEIDNKQK